ncbi:MAG TPA: endonuclease/exonuclease/phosphatase family protein [Actinomycetota bacterium]
MINGTSVRSRSPGRIRVTVAVLTAATLAVAAWSPPAGATPPEHARCCMEVMTYNMYLGANLQPLFFSDPEDLPGIVDDIWAHVQQVDFNLRAEAIARQIVEAQPWVVGLQELSVWQTAPLSNPGQLTTKYDFLQILLDELALQGHPYRAVSVNETFSGMLPGTTQWVRWTDRNAIIVRDDLPVAELTTANSMEGKFVTALPAPVGGTTIRFTRGWASVDVRFDGEWLRVFDTHFEAFNVLVRQAQVGELVALMSTSPHPVVLVGDINLYPEGQRPMDQPAWDLLTGAGFVDSWVESLSAFPAYTAGQPDDLDCTLASTLNNTVDFVLHNADGSVDAVRHSGDTVGEDPSDCTETMPPLWPSDHAGVVLRLLIDKP